MPEPASNPAQVQLRQVLAALRNSRLADEELLERFLTEREEAAFAALVKRHGPMVLSICQSVLHHTQDAEDVCQATFLLLARKAAGIRKKASVASWLHGVALRLARQLKSTNARNAKQPRAGQAPANPLDELSWSEVRQIVHEELERLPESYRLPVILCYLEGRTQEQAARALGCTAATIKGRLDRGRAMLHRRLTRRGLGLAMPVVASCLAPGPAVAGLVHATARSAVRLLTGQTLGEGISSQAAALAKIGLGGTLMTTLKIGGLMVAALGIIAAGVALAASLAGDAANPGAPPGQAAKKPLPVVDLPHRFDLLSPAARLQLLDKITKEDSEFEPASRGDIVMKVVARGILESVDSGDIYCTVRSGTKGISNGTIVKSIVDDGSKVRKGDVLVVLDDSGLQEQLKSKTRDYQQAIAVKNIAEAALDLQKLRNQADELAGEIAIRDAELNLKKYTGNDVDEKDTLKLKVEKARLSMQLAKTEGKLRLLHAQADLEAKTTVAVVELELLQGIKDQIAQCTMVAPTAGRVIYYVPESVRFGTGSQQPIVAQGEPVREGQKLMQIPDLNNMRVNLRVPEALVSPLYSETKDKSQWLSALIKVDAYPNLVLKGHVKHVDTIPTTQDFLKNEGKFYKTLISIDNDKNPKMPTLVPGFSAEVTIERKMQSGVVRVPVQALLRGGKQDYFCYVKVGNEIQKREVMRGLATEQVVEIRAGVKEGEAVLRDVDSVLKRLSPFLGPAVSPEKKL